MALGMIALVYWFVVGADSRFEDMAVRTSQRNYERIQAARRGNIYTSASSRTEYASSLLPRLPWWRGVGPNLHRHLVCGLRDMRSMLRLG